MTRILGSVLLIAAVALTPADAQVRVRSVCYDAHSNFYPSAYNYYTPTYYAPTYYTPPVYKESIYTQFIQVPTIAYGLGYGNPDTSLKLDLLQLKNENLQLKNDFLQFQLKQSQSRSPLESKAPPMPPMGQVEQSPHQASLTAGGRRYDVFAAKCSSCHDNTTAATKGAGLVLTTNGRLAPLTYAQAMDVTYVLYSGKTKAGATMPPNGKLSDEQAGVALLEANPAKQ